MEFLPKEQCQKVNFLYVILPHDINYIVLSYEFHIVQLSYNVWRRAEIALGLVLYRVPCQCRALAWSFIVINRKVCSAELE